VDRGRDTSVDRGSGGSVDRATSLDRATCYGRWHRGMASVLRQERYAKCLQPSYNTNSTSQDRLASQGAVC
jgi:hypothetical protein